MADYYLIVVRPFGDHGIGDLIDGDDAMRAAEADHMADVVRVLLPDDRALNYPDEKGA